MAAIPPATVLTREDNPDLPDKLLRPLNTFMAATSTAFRGITFGQNFKASVRDGLRVTIPDPVWTAPTLVNSWVNEGSGTFNDAGYRVRPDGTVEFKGRIKNGSAIPTTITTLPVGYRPDRTYVFPVNSNGAFGVCEVSAAGVVTASAGSTLGFVLDDVNFIATAPAAAPSFTGTPGGTSWPVFVSHGLGVPCKSLLALSCKLKDPGITDAVGPFQVDWDDTGDGRVKIKSLWGLTPGKSYIIKLLCMAE